MTTENTLPVLNARLEPWVRSLVTDKSTLDSAIREYGSPIHIHCKEPFLANIEAFKKTFANAQVSGRIYYARKANAFYYFNKIASDVGLGIDVASLHELQDTLNQGIPGKDIIVTAAAKSRELLEQSLKHNSCIVLDNWSELERLKEISALKSPNVMIRLSGFSFQTGNKISRFGFSINQISDVLKSITSFNLNGFQFHLDGYSLDERIQAIQESLPIFTIAKNFGQSPKRLDIGGGFPVSYLESPIQFENFLREILASQKGKRSPFIYRNDGLSVSLIDGKLIYSSLYPVATELYKHKFLERILNSQLSCNSTIAEYLNNENIELCIEPGRALLDGAGVTVSSVSHDKQLESSARFVTLDMNQTQCKAVSREFCIDPIWLGNLPSSTTPGYLTGDTCMETDLILRRMIPIPSPLPSDALVLFPNTAGYQMHLFQNAGHRGILPRNLIWSSLNGISLGEINGVNR